MAGAGPATKATKPPDDCRSSARRCKRLDRSLTMVSYKIMQVLVGTGLLVGVRALAFIASVQRLFWTPVELHKSRRHSQQPAQMLKRTSALTPAAADGVKGISKAQIVIGAVAATPTSLQPVILHNDPEKGHTSEAWRLVGPYMKLYGRNAIANSQLFNPEYIHYFVPGIGSLPYIVADLYNRVLVSVIGDPLSHRINWRILTEMFVKDFPNTYFYHASESYAALLHDMGFCINDVGAETTVQIQSWTYSAKTRTIRASARSARDAGVRVRELSPEDMTPEMRKHLQEEVSGDWLQQKAVADRELRVFVRNVDYDNLQLQDGVRIFVAEQYHPATAPPAVVDRAIQGVSPNSKPPKPPRSKSSRSLASQASGGSLMSQMSGALSRTSSMMSNSSGSSSSGSSSSGSSSSGSSSSGSSSSGSSSSSSNPGTAETAVCPEGKTELGAARRSPSKSERGTKRSESGGKAGVTFCDITATAATAAVAAEPSSGKAPPPVVPSPFQVSTAEAAAACGDAAAAAGAPELIGFVLLDPLWENNTEIGYVSSICRMKRSAHQGTLKLLYEDIISKLRSEGKRELAFGFAPLFNVRDDRFDRVALWIRWTHLYLYHFGNNLYAFQNLAFSKTRYGAGVDGDKIRDLNVSMSHVYMACRSQVPCMQLLDLYVLCMYVGFMGDVVDTWLKLVGLKKGVAHRSELCQSAGTC